MSDLGLDAAVFLELDQIVERIPWSRAVKEKIRRQRENKIVRQKQVEHRKDDRDEDIH